VTAVRKILEGLDDVEVTLGHFQQGGETYHTPRKIYGNDSDFLQSSSDFQ